MAKQHAEVAGARRQRHGVFAGGGGPQFLWAARRHDILTEHALLLAQQRCRVSQQQDGHWDLKGKYKTPAMTAVVLLGLAMGHAASVHLETVAGRVPGARNDLQIQKGLSYLAY